ncbi:hypothetical protein SDJN02_15767, partial [Cucurbita argyrosperma subsp. argyrosperma]
RPFLPGHCTVRPPLLPDAVPAAAPPPPPYAAISAFDGLAAAPSLPLTLFRLSEQSKNSSKRSSYAFAKSHATAVHSSNATSSFHLALQEGIE